MGLDVYNAETGFWMKFSRTELAWIVDCEDGLWGRMKSDLPICAGVHFELADKIFFGKFFCPTFLCWLIRKLTRDIPRGTVPVLICPTF